MIRFKRSDENPILVPNPDNDWEGEASFNGCPIVMGGKVILLYRAESLPLTVGDASRRISSIGYASSKDGLHFENRRQFVRPEYAWERYGCEDPRVTKLDVKYYIFYTALSQYPFRAEGIRVGLAITKDFKTIVEKHSVTTFNSKAMALFPERINGKIAAILTVNTDNPPAKIAIAIFDSESQIWSERYWAEWYATLNNHVIPLERSSSDQIEVGAPPIKTKYGWLLLYSHIQNYFSPPSTFGVESALLNLNNPHELLSRTKKALMVPREEYEKYGRVPNIIFPAGAIVKGKELHLYYGAADTICATATIGFDELVNETLGIDTNIVKLERFIDNPVLSPNPKHPWESQATFNPGAIHEEGRVHLLYRAMSADNTSVFGYASTANGTRITERLPEPVYIPRMNFETKHVEGGNSGCEDPRLTRIGDTLYMCYTAFNGKDPPRVALTTIKMVDFMLNDWNWTEPVLISPPDVPDKDAAIFPKKIKGKYAILHRLGESIWIDFVENLDFDGNRWIYGEVLMTPLQMLGESKKIGIAGPPIETSYGWLLFYHGISAEESYYNIRAALLRLDDPLQVVGRTYVPILEPETDYERRGIVNNVVFSCGAVVMENKIFFYYGAADKVIAVATLPISELVDKLRP
jgi:beta-1,2-mannobiose phosphorylase / 1,2-beta-oligomannan phosphorylase